MERINLYGLLPEEIEKEIAPIGAPSYRAGQLFRWVQKQRAADFAQMTNLPAGFRAELEKIFRVFLPEVVRRSDAPRGASHKLLCRFPDGVSVETVAIAGKKGMTLCVSSQAGCGYDCTFCATAIGGLQRSLQAAEIVGQVLALEEPPKRIVYMGMGEPLANYGNVVKSIRILTHPDGLAISPGRITVSTVGLTPMIDRLESDKTGVRLAISLVAGDDSKRSRLMPVNRKYPLAPLLESAARFARSSGHPVTFEYPMLAGVNDGVEDARVLVRKLNSIKCKVNLIPWNRVDELPYSPPGEESINRFLGILSGRLTVTVRRSAGREIDAACGQLRLRHIEEEPG